MKKAIITGITGQDGAYLTQLLLDKNYEVYEIETCKNSTFDSDKMKCLSENGAPFKKVCLPRQDVLFQLNASMSDLQSKNFGSLEKRLIFLTAKFSENCQ